MLSLSKHASFDARAKRGALRTLVDGDPYQKEMARLQDMNGQTGETASRPERIGAYEIDDELGRGGFGVVYQAWDEERALVAIKVLNATLKDRPELRALFEDESRKLRALSDHPHIVKLLDYGDHHDQPYLVMEYLRGRQLRYLLGDGPLSIQPAVKIAAQVASALDHAAGSGLIHCDIKPENLQVQRDGPTVVVMDFGIAWTAKARHPHKAGTAVYMAPELWRGSRPEPATDIYALGCVLYEMLTGQPPFTPAPDDDRARARRELEQRHLTAEPDWSPFQSEVCPPELLALLKRMLAKSPVVRPTASQVMRTLEQLLPAISPAARLDSLAEVRPGELSEDEIPTNPHIVEPVPPAPASPPTPITTPTPDWRAIPAGTRVEVKLHVARLDLGTQACRAVLAQDGMLLTGSLAGQVHRIDLHTGRARRWEVMPPHRVRSANWALAYRGGHLWLHAGDAEWFEIETEAGRLVRQGTLPEAEMTFSRAGEWLYLSGMQEAFYRAPLNDLAQQNRYELKSKVIGAPCAGPDTVYVPTAEGLLGLDPASGQVTPIGPKERVRAVTWMPQDRLVAIYPTLGEDNIQHSQVRVFDVAFVSGHLLAETEVRGQQAGSALVVGERVMLACRDGHVWAWDLTPSGDRWKLVRAWDYQAASGYTLPCGPSLGGGLLALVPTRGPHSTLVVLNTADGQPAPGISLKGNVFVAPAWWQNLLGLILGDGTAEVYQVSGQAPVASKG